MTPPTPRDENDRSEKAFTDEVIKITLLLYLRLYRSGYVRL